MADKAPPPAPLTHPATPIIIPLLILLFLGVIGTAGAGAYFLKNAFFLEVVHLLALFFTGQATLSEIAALTSSRVVQFLIQIFLLVSFMLSVWFFFLVFSTARKVSHSTKKLFDTIAPPAGYAPAHTAATPATSAPSPAALVGGIVLPGSGVNAPPILSEVNPKWLKVLEHIRSDSAADWKLAILEADIMLDAMLEKMGYPGQTIGEKLKLVEKSDFDTIDYAWEAHKIRNSIAHEGSDFVVTKEEAERVITMFERVFKEFRYI